MAAPVTTRGLSPADVDQLRGSLAAGRRPKVTFTDAAGQIAGQTGQVVAVGEPADSDEWITVRFGKDELPFSPADLALPGRGGTRPGPAAAASPKRAVPAKPSRGATAVASPARPAPEPEFVLDKAPAARRSARTPAPKPEEPAAPSPATTDAAPPPATATVATAAADTPAVATRPEPPTKPVKTAKPKVPASLVVTLSYAEREWTLAATQGTKALAKPYVISPSEALRMVAMVDLPTVQEAVENIIAAERIEAEGRAERLRAELAEIEARLVELAQHA